MATREEKNTRRLATLTEAVAALGLSSPRALHRLVENGAPGPEPGQKGSRRYDVEAIGAWREARRAKERPALDLSVERAKLAKVQWQLTTLKLREARGELVRAREVVEIQRAIAAAVRAEILTLPRRAVLAGMPREHEPAIKRLVSDALRELSGVKTIADLTTKAGVEDDAP